MGLILILRAYLVISVGSTTSFYTKQNRKESKLRSRYEIITCLWLKTKKFSKLFLIRNILIMSPLWEKDLLQTQELCLSSSSNNYNWNQVWLEINLVCKWNLLPCSPINKIKATARLMETNKFSLLILKQRYNSSNIKL